MKAYAMLKIGAAGWIEKDRPLCGPMDAICRPLAVAICTSDIHTVWEGAVSYTHLDVYKRQIQLVDRL